MKTKILILILGALMMTVGCVKEDEKKAAAAAATPKDLFSVDWYVSNRAWSVDLRLGNLTGGSFTMYVNYSNSAQCSCTTTITGDQSFGSMQTSCTASMPIGSVTNATCASDFNQGGTGTYSNSGTMLRLCKTNTTNCINYY